MKGQTYVILSIVFVIIIAVFSVLNIDQVEVNYLFWSGSSPLIFVILFSVLLVGVLTTGGGAEKYISINREHTRLREMLRQLELETNTTTEEVLARETEPTEEHQNEHEESR